MRIIFVRTKERTDMQPLLVGLLEKQSYSVTGPVSEPEFRDGFHQVTIMDHDMESDGADMVYTYERGSLNREVYKESKHGSR